MIKNVLEIAGKQFQILLKFMKRKDLKFGTRRRKFHVSLVWFMTKTILISYKIP